ncbi:MAG: phosphatidylserine decarboxylase family protein [Bacteroidales bacterium]
MKIHKEGYTILLVSFFVLLALNFISYVFSHSACFFVILPASFLLMLFLLRFFRVPSRVIPNEESTVFSPADGTVVAIEEVQEDEFLKTRCIQVSVFMSVWNVHINWFPIKGIIKYFKYHPGEYLVAWHPKSSTHNERTTVVIERNDGVAILLRQIAGAVARRIVCYAEEGKSVEQCSEMGFIKFGSRVDIFLPLDANVQVKLNEKVTGNKSIIATVPIRKQN